MAIFDRFIRYQWAERALETAVQNQKPRSLDGWLLSQGLALESAKRTSNLLRNLWFDVDAHTISLQKRAIELVHVIGPSEHLALHWGMAISRFPLFRETAKTIGRLGRLQIEFRKREIVIRMLEKYSNQSTIQRATERVIQTMFEWGVLQKPKKGVYQLSPARVLLAPTLAEWLFRAVMLGEPEKYWLTMDLLRSTDNFPFELEPHTTLLYHSPHLTVERDSYGAEIVGINDVAT